MKGPSTNLTINGQSYPYPRSLATQWGTEATNWAIAVTNGMLQKTGGLFSLQSDLSFGLTYGVHAAYFGSALGEDLATNGILRLQHGEVIGWRNQANNGNLTLGFNSSDQFVVNGNLVGTVTSITATSPPAGFAITGSPITTSGTLVFTLTDDLAAVESISTTGLAARTASNTWTTRTLTAGANISITNGDAVSGNPTISVTDVGSVTSVAATQPAAGFTISGSPITSSGTLAFALSDDLAAVEDIGTLGLAARTDFNIWTTRSIGGTTDRLSVTNGDGVSGNPTLDISSSYVGQTSITTLGTIATGTWNGTTVAIPHGGTGRTSYNGGDIIYAGPGGTSLATLPIGSHGNVLTVSGGAPVWQTPTNQTITLSGDATGSGTSGITVAIPTFAGSAKGLVPASPGGTTNYLRADGSWAAPPGGGGSGTVTSVNITPPAAGITASGGPITTSGSIALALADDLAAVEGLSSNGMAARTGTSTWTTRTITGTANTVTVTNGTGVSGNPTITIANNPVFPGTVATAVQYASAEVDSGSSGTAKTVTWTSGQNQVVTMTGNCTFTFASPSHGATYKLRLVQDATGSRTATWPATVKWAGGAPPTLSTAANAIDIVTFYWNGTNYFGQGATAFA